MKKFFQEFKTFLNRGNAMEMAVGIVMGTSFKAIVSSLVNDLIMPLISSIGGINVKDLVVVLKEAVMDGDKVVKAAVVLKYGAFIQTVIDFLIIAFSIFMIVKIMNSINKKLEAIKLKLIKEQEEEEASKEAKEEPKESVEDILKDIRDSLKHEQTNA